MEISMILLVAHDAGGAEILSSWALRQAHSSLGFLLNGPAQGIFERKLGSTLEKLENIPFNARQVTKVICGTGSGNFEIFAWRMANICGIPSVAWLDHWKNYSIRFRTDNGLALPNEIWVTDRWAKNLALAELSDLSDDIHISIQGNPYLEDVVAEVRILDEAQARKHSEQQVLYVSEPGREREFEKYLATICPNVNLRERPHPSIATTSNSLAQDIHWAHTVVGCDSMAMAIALRAGRKVLSVLPPDEALSIPYPGIERVNPASLVR
jgi:hypothetical protein